MNCHFCLGASGAPLSNEHLVSKPVADAFGIDRWGDLTSVDMATLTLGPSRPLEQLKVRIACSSCNSGWMQQLEEGMHAVAKWVNGKSVGMTPETFQILWRWLLKTHIVLAAIEGGTRRFGKGDDWQISLPATQGRMLYDGDDSVLDDVAFEFARRQGPAPNRFSYRIENARSQHTGGQDLPIRVAPLAAIRGRCRPPAGRQPRHALFADATEKKAGGVQDVVARRLDRRAVDPTLTTETLAGRAMSANPSMEVDGSVVDELRQQQGNQQGPFAKP